MKHSVDSATDVFDVLATAVYLAAVELAEIHPQANLREESIEVWKKYLLQQAAKKQESMSPEERVIFRATHLT